MQGTQPSSIDGLLQVKFTLEAFSGENTANFSGLRGRSENLY